MTDGAIFGFERRNSLTESKVGSTERPRFIPEVPKLFVHRFELRAKIDDFLVTVHA
jgi:hypothetical protein